MKINTHVALAAALAAMAVPLSFPVVMQITNNDWRQTTEPESGAYMLPYAGHADGSDPVKVVVRDYSHLVRIVGNIEQINTLHGAEGDGGMWLATIEATDSDAQAGAAGGQANEVQAAAGLSTETPPAGDDVATQSAKSGKKAKA